MLYVVCLGLGDERGVTLRGLDAVRRCARVYMEFYAALLAIGTSDDPSSRLASLFRRRANLVIRAKNMGIQVEVIDSASVVNAVGVCGLQLHRFGEAITIPFFTECCKPDRFYQAIVNNRWLGLHTLCPLGS
ncbi:hypothetical protein PR202_ga25730 [Eleusine coracana subsp. coracana]|uniref:Diphthine methyl ester synthase n=1 Tax=Eleusine coracana subsp. coracana TaxID=191504 RepID=A0AAV5DBH5_ELECO|nr:hypothetical protein QOZ80_3AG0248540 [Eleusine coracana subsp. coracana]GJN07862.1 hypothetical protein PR202_ga25730 [Eleusine coracana subsp. coracana]